MDRILIVDGQGGGVGRQLVENIKKECLDCEVIAVGTNAVATQTMLKAGADHAATGENAVIAGCRKASVIMGPVGIVIADSLWGEITPAMAVAIGQADAVRILLPMNQCDNQIVGIEDVSVGRLVQYSMEEIRRIRRSKNKSCNMPENSL